MATGKGFEVDDRDPTSCGGLTESRYTDRRYGPACSTEKHSVADCLLSGAVLDPKPYSACSNGYSRQS
jgi:hypothetical protein